MPHDHNGQGLQKGDIVNVPCQVTEVTATDEYCNCSLKTVYPMYPNATMTGLSLNTRQVEKVTAPAKGG